eukprot:TRINITY_DN1166_c0_g1_i1.p1 TRINITY_DN1166_c0_g1~~TRINITY_DN1166_c0_g1_i1.p1  ORF type:complete len:282 (+),score=137.59 TRINITY_DN1166_c0_g1_i1:25-870(+)
MKKVITFDEALAQLLSMFGESHSLETIIAVLKENKGHLERTISQLLEMKPTATPSPPPAQHSQTKHTSAAPTAPTVPTPSTAPTVSVDELSAALALAATLTPATQAAPATTTTTTAKKDDEEAKRRQMEQDEQLARELQLQLIAEDVEDSPPQKHKEGSEKKEEKKTATKDDKPKDKPKDKPTKPEQKYVVGKSPTKSHQKEDKDDKSIEMQTKLESKDQMSITNTPATTQPSGLKSFANKIAGVFSRDSHKEQYQSLLGSDTSQEKPEDSEEDDEKANKK